ncbi:hypothetical protein M0802_015195 [Mischocyttarus mexicanus]|nr:hypothetical protein M0802_015195 [Mischocyttarus mexicanus]
MRIFGKIKLWSTVEKDYDDAWTRNCTFSTSNDYEIVWTTNCTFYRNYKSSDPLRPLRKEIQIFGEIKLWSPVEKDYDNAWTRNCTFSARYHRKTQRGADRYEKKQSDMKWSIQI